MFFLCLFVLPAQAVDFKELASRKAWLNQLQYRKTLLGQWKSEADGPDFFISAEGKTSPLAELMATYELLKTHPEKPWGYISQPVICAFPTRKKFLEIELGIQFSEVPCVERDKWLESFKGSQFYLIYSSAYPNNPASMFGHTFVLFSKHSPPDSSEGFLDYSINFSADTTSADEKSLWYTFKGIFGGYPGRYRPYPFYQMVNLYINWESRDLWYLKIPWTDDQVNRYLNHVWEIFTTTHFDYFFLDENCSYRLLAAMDYADPGLNLNDQFYSRAPAYYVAPLATYKAVEDAYKGRTSQHFTPSLQKNLKNELAQLSAEERALFNQYTKDLKNIERESNVKVLDSLVTYFDYKKRSASANYLPPEILKGLDQTLRRRAQLTVPSSALPPIPAPPSPLESHGAHSLSLGIQNSSSEVATFLGGKVAYHDLLSPTAGFERWSHLNFLEFAGSYFHGDFKLDSFVGLNIMSFFPIQSYESRWSWRVEFGYDQAYYGYLRGGPGVSLQTPNERTLIYSFLSPLVSTSANATGDQGFVGEAEIGLVHEFRFPLKTWFFYRDVLRFPDWDFSEKLESVNFRLAFYPSQSGEIRLEWENIILSETTKLIYQYNF